MKATIGTYIKDRNNAMLAYPDTTKLEALVKDYHTGWAWDWH